MILSIANILMLMVWNKSLTCLKIWSLKKAISCKYVHTIKSITFAQIHKWADWEGITDCMLPHRWVWPTVAHNIVYDAIISLVSAMRIQQWQRHAFQLEGIHQDIPELYSCNQCCQVVTQHGDASNESTNQSQLVR